MITGEIKNRIDSIWDTFWTGGITNSITILEQMTYLFFMKMLDDAHAKLMKQIEQLEKKTRTEKQPRKKLELFEKLKELKRRL